VERNVSWSKRYTAGRKRLVEPTNEITYRAQCGSPYGYDLHRKNSEPACILCQEAVRDKANKRNRDRGVQEFKPAACGTNGGYMRHLRQDEEACGDCLEAHRDHVLWFILPISTRQKINQEVNEEFGE